MEADQGCMIYSQHHVIKHQRIENSNEKEEDVHSPSPFSPSRSSLFFPFFFLISEWMMWKDHQDKEKWRRYSLKKILQLHFKILRKWHMHPLSFFFTLILKFPLLIIKFKSKLFFWHGCYMFFLFSFNCTLPLEPSFLCAS